MPPALPPQRLSRCTYGVKSENPRWLSETLTLGSFGDELGESFYPSNWSQSDTILLKMVFDCRNVWKMMFSSIHHIFRATKNKGWHRLPPSQTWDAQRPCWIVYILVIPPRLLCVFLLGVNYRFWMRKVTKQWNTEYSELLSAGFYSAGREVKQMETVLQSVSRPSVTFQVASGVSWLQRSDVSHAEGFVLFRHDLSSRQVRLWKLRYFSSPPKKDLPVWKVILSFSAISHPHGAVWDSFLPE